MCTSGSKIVERIDNELKKRNLKRFAVCEFAGISTQAITHWSKQGSMPAADTALKIAEYLNVSVEWLITGETKSTDLSPEVLQLVDNYEALDPSDRMVVDNLIESLLLRYTHGGQMDESEKRLG